MAKVSEATKLYVPAGRVWDTIGRFADIDSWHLLVLRAVRFGSA